MLERLYPEHVYKYVAYFEAQDGEKYADFLNDERQKYLQKNGKVHKPYETYFCHEHDNEGGDDANWGSPKASRHDPTTIFV